MNAFGEGLLTIALAIIGLGLASVLVSPRARTSQVIQAGATGFATAIGVAQGPVTGQSFNFSLGYPAGGGPGYGFGS